MTHHEHTDPRAHRRGRALTDLTIVLDRSGSMSLIAPTVVDEINRLVDTVTTDDTSVTLNIYTFGGHDPLDVLVEGAGTSRTEVLTLDDYRPRGSTPLYDAVGSALRRVSERRHRDRVVFDHLARPLIAVVTDGMENASTMFGAVDVLGMVQRRRSRGWRFLWLGVGDAHRDARRLGFAPAEVQPWEATDRGTTDAFTTVSSTAGIRRRNGGAR